MFKKGISLIVLVITIIVIIILAGALIINLNNNNPIESAQEAVDKSNLSTIKEAANLELVDLIDENNGNLSSIDVAEAIKTRLASKGMNIDGYDITYPNGSLVVTKSSDEVISEDWAFVYLTEDDETIIYLVYIGKNISVTLPYNKITAREMNAEDLTITDRTEVLNIENDFTINNYPTWVAFLDGSAITSITIPASITKVPDRLCSEISEESGFPNLSSIIIPDSVTTIGKYSITHVTGLTNFTIPSSIVTIDDGAFNGCALTSITIPSSVTTIGERAFQCSPNLSSITLTEGLQTIGSEAFMYDTSLTSITIPSSVTTIASNTFEGCSSLTSIIVNKAQENCSGFESGWNGNATVTYNPQL